MDIRRFLRGRLPRSDLEDVAEEVASRYGESMVSVDPLEADNWLSVPFVVNDRWFVKIITEQHTVVHAVLTAGRNIGAFSSGTEGFFERFETPLQMAEHELEATRQMRDLGLHAPEPLQAFAHGDFGVVVFEYLASFRTLGELSPERAREFAPLLFEQLSRMHAAGLAHGDLREENVLVAPGPDDHAVDGETIYFIDATNVSDNAIEDARAYDLACALGALAPQIGARSAVSAAREFYSTTELLEARDFLDFVRLRPDHDFDGELIKGEIEKTAA